MRTRPIQHGLTLIELLIGLAGTALIGAAIATMVSAVTYGTTSSRELRELAVKNKALSSRISATVRKSVMVLEQGNDFLVLWVFDLDGDGTPSTLEIQRLDYDAAADELTSYGPDAGAADSEYALTDDFEAITDVLMGTADFPGALWAGNATTWTVTLDDVAQSARLLNFQLTLSAGDLNDVAIATIALRN